MAFDPQEFTRPDLPYANVSLPNSNRFQILTRALGAPPTDIMLDSEFNSITDNLNTIEGQMADIVLGEIPGSTDPGNANFILGTTGSALQWIQISDINIQLASIDANKLIPSSVTSNEIGDAAIISSKIAGLAVTRDKIANLAIDTSKIAAQSITRTQIAPLTVDDSRIAVGAITPLKLAANAVTTEKLAANAVTTEKLAANAVTAQIMLDGSVTTDKLAANAVTADKMANNTITATQIANDTITFTQINNSFTATKAQQQAASSTSVYTSPGRQQDHPGSLKSTFSCDGAGNILSSYNIASITKISASIFEITMTVPMSTVNYEIIPSLQNNPGQSQFAVVTDNFTPTTAKFRITAINPTGSNTAPFRVYCHVSGTQ